MEDKTRENGIMTVLTGLISAAATIATKGTLDKRVELLEMHRKGGYFVDEFGKTYSPLELASQNELATLLAGGIGIMFAVACAYYGIQFARLYLNDRRLRRDHA